MVGRGDPDRGEQDNSREVGTDIHNAVLVRRHSGMFSIRGIDRYALVRDRLPVTEQRERPFLAPDTDKLQRLPQRRLARFLADVTSINAQECLGVL